MRWVDFEANQVRAPRSAHVNGRYNFDLVYDLNTIDIARLLFRN